MPSPRAAARLSVVAVLGGSFLGLLPPAAGDEVVQPEVRIVELDEARLVPRGAPRTAAPAGGVALAQRSWSRRVRACSSEPFTLGGFVWRQSGETAAPARVSWSGGRTVSLVADPDEGPDPGSPDDAGLVGTPPVWTGPARCLAFRVRLPAGETVADLRAVLVDTSPPAAEPAFLDRAADILASAWGLAAKPLEASRAEALPAQPPIITRAAWGADEKLRRCGPDYAPSLEMAHVHHTVNSNAYSRSQADDLIRGIYAYHVKGRKYCDIAYNFLIDRFGRIYEGRSGGIDQPVIGAHAMGFNTGSTGVAALGTFTKDAPPRKVISAYKRLLAWRLDVAHVRPTGTTVMTSGGGSTTRFDKGEQVTLPVISGHRDTGLTSCPGAKLYERLQKIRTGAERRGLPKIWDPSAAPNPAPAGTTQIQLTATLSRDMTWSVEIYSAAAPTTPFKRFAGQGSAIAVTWDRRGDDPVAPPAPAGTYQVYVRANAGALVAREAVLTLTLG